MTMFQPVGGMDMIGKAFAGELGGLIRYDAKVTRIDQGDDGVTVSYVSAKSPAEVRIAPAGQISACKFRVACHLARHAL